MNKIDMIIIGFILVMALIGFIKGFISTTFNLAGYICAIICIKIFSPNLSAVLYNTPLASEINNLLLNKLNNISLPASSMDLKNFDSSLTQIPQLNKLLNTNPFLNNILDNSLLLIKQNAVDFILRIILISISSLAIFIGVKLAFFLVSNIINAVVYKSGSLNLINRLLGSFLGGLTGIILIIIIFVIVSPFIFTSSTPEIISKSIILKMFYSSEFYAKILTSISKLLHF